MKRKGVVLMMTLVLITMLLGVVALILLQNKAIDTKSRLAVETSQKTRIIEDLEQQMPQLFSKVVGAQELDMAIRLPFDAKSNRGNFELYATLSSPYTKLNINRLVDVNGSVNQRYVDAWMGIFTAYPIADSQLLLKLVLDTIDTDSVNRDIESEIIVTTNDFSNGSIASMEQFYQVLEYYKIRTRDGSVLKIPWEKYIGFEGDRMDINAISASSLALLLPQVSPEEIQRVTTHRTKAYETKDEAVAALGALGEIYDTFLFLFAPSVPYDVVCDIEIVRNGLSDKSQFYYNITDKKIHHVKL